MKQLAHALSLLAFTSLASHAADFPPARWLGDTNNLGRAIQRTMRRLAESTPEHRNTVRILFYGQSITEQDWWKIVAADLRARFPHANLVIENRALGGFASQMLSRTAETDLYPFQPDLLIFHVYGAHDKYEDIVRRTREQTTAEILIQTDHVTKPADLMEETDPAKLPPAGKHWDAFMNHNWLPAMSRKYGTGLCDQRAVWKAYLAEHKLEPSALLRDAVHLNPHGEFLMAECVKAYLRRDARFDPPPADEWVKTHVVGRDVKWEDGRLKMEFEGSRVVALCGPGATVRTEVLVDGRKPSTFPETYGFSRAVTTVKWPVIAPIGSEAPLLVEDWTLKVTRTDVEGKVFAFSLSGSETGPDGEGRSDAKFVSKSRRVVIRPENWNVAYAVTLAGIKPVPETFTVKWRSETRSVDVLASLPPTVPGQETEVTLAQGLPRGRHTLELLADPAAPVVALRVHRPPLQVANGGD